MPKSEEQRKKNREKVKAWRKKYPEKYRAVRRAYYHKRMKRDPDVNRRKQIVRAYGITLEEYDEFLRKQGGGCAICGSTKCPHGYSMPVDHCHITGKVRGVLCDQCNKALGLLGDDVDLLMKAIRYLQKKR